MRITVRLIVALALSAAFVVGGATYFQMAGESRRLLDDLGHRAAMLAESVDVVVDPADYRSDPALFDKYAKAFAGDRRVKGFAICGPGGEVLVGTPALKDEAASISALAREAIVGDAAVSRVGRYEGLELLAYGVPLHSNTDSNLVTGALIILQDLSAYHDRLAAVWRNNFFRLLLQVFLLSLVALWIVRWSVMAPIDQLAAWMRRARSGEAPRDFSPPRGLPEHLAAEAAQLAKSLSAARIAAEDEARLRQTAQALWTPERLKEHVRQKLDGRPLFVAANREPYMHIRQGKKTQVIVPASGLVTGIEPILRACGGTWVAHGAGDGDREMSDAHGRLQVPPEEPAYTLKRVWLSREEEEGYYYGFSNQGLWPLCQIIHMRPVFESADWEQYKAVNRKFADSLLEELEGATEPCVLVQDYHFALLPKMIKQARPDARVAIFWHIPWPNPESFGICPWQKEILEGMLGADLIGFHIQYHCNNFLETVDRTLESRIDWEHFTVKRGGHSCAVKPFPISVAFTSEGESGAFPAKEALLKELGVKARWMGVGVDRVDHTKGLIERLRAVERFLDKYPEYQGQFTFVELGSPSRTHIPRYRDLLAEVESEAERINWRFGRKDYKAVVFLKKHHSHAEIAPYYKAADLCLVSSLHDGMNLVSKEFVAARDDEKGVLVLSQFTGAARELRDALIVNPYDIEQSADALRYALEMGEPEQRRRMSAMRRTLRENNIYLWAAKLIDELAAVRLPVPRAPAGLI